MRRVFLCCVLALLLSIPALAVEETEPDMPEAPVDIPMEEPSDPVTVETIKKEEEGVTVNVTIQQPETAPVEELPAELVEDAPQDVLEDEESLPVVRTFSVSSLDDLAPLSLGDAPQVMADAVIQVLGEYHQKTYTVQEVDSSGNVVATSMEYVPGLAGLDYPWIAGAVFFGLFLVGIFKLLGGLMRS